jgi:hypothetical protein
MVTKDECYEHWMAPTCVSSECSAVRHGHGCAGAALEVINFAQEQRHSMTADMLFPAAVCPPSFPPPPPPLPHLRRDTHQSLIATRMFVLTLAVYPLLLPPTTTTTQA